MNVHVPALPRAWQRAVSAPAAALGALMLVEAVVVAYLAQDLTFNFDEWAWVQERRGWGPDSFLRSSNEHPSLVPVLVFKLLFVTAGLTTYWPYQAVGLGFHLLVAGLVYVVARRRVAPWLSVAAAALVLFLGAGWENILWPFQIGFLGSVAAGLGILAVLDRDLRYGDALVALLFGVALASSSVGITLALPLLVTVLWRPDRWRSLWVVALPLAAYAAWWARYGRSELEAGGSLASNATAVPAWVPDAAAAASGGLFGLGLDWGRPLVLLGVALLLRRFFLPARVPPALVLTVVAALTFWSMTALARAHISPPTTGRYLYVGAILVVLVALELLRGVEIRGQGLAVLALVVAMAAVADYRILREATRELQATSRAVTAGLGVLELAREGIDPAFQPLPGHAPQIRAGLYLEAVRDLGSPAASVEEILAGGDPEQALADDVLVRALGVVSEPGAGDACAPGEAARSLDLAVAGDGLQITTSVAPAELRLRRFADAYPESALAVLPSRRSVRLELPAGGLARPWHVRLTSPAPVAACSLVP